MKGLSSSPKSEIGLPENRPRPPSLPYLTPPRFAAALAVLVFHAWLNWLNATPKPSAVNAGYLGVGFFFVLSGFILAHAYGEKSVNNRSFWFHRFVRIYPAYLLGLLITLVGFAKVLRSYKASGHTLNVVLDPAAHFTLLHSWNKTFYMSWNYPGWTLGVEAFFYLLFPFVLPHVKRLTLSGALGLAIACWTLTLCRFVIPIDPWFMTRHPLGRTPEFLFGIAIWVVYRRTTESIQSRITKPLLFASLATTVAIYACHDLFPKGSLDGGTLMPVWGGLIFSLACVPAPENPSPILRTALILGDASYSMYILQAGLIAAVGYVTTRVAFLDNHRALSAIIGVGIVIAGGIFSHQVLETPIRLALRKRFDRSNGIRPAGSL